ncbi:hypothetical protein SESBI_15811 [Sesbania bispinosa]|nr:hypothetical protein SESBI_15811 [Sesbania bispinosa]
MELNRVPRKRNTEELSILCGIPTCSVVSGPGDTEPKIWPSSEVAKQLLQRLEEVPKGVKSKKCCCPPNPPPTPPVSCPQENEVLEKQSSLDLVKEANQLNDGFYNDNNIGSSSMGLQPPHANLSDVDMVFPQENFGGFNNVWPEGNFGDLNDGSDLLEMYNFEGINGESGDSSQVLPEGNFGDLNDGSDLLKILFEEQHNENQGGFINNSGANTHEAAIGRFDANFVGNNNGNNLNFGLPTHGIFASSGEFGSDTQMPTSFGGNFP